MATLREVQAPLKERYREDPGAALITLHAQGALGDGVSCSLETGRAMARAGLHPAAGGDGTLLCSGDMLLEALVACAGVTLSAVATSLGIEVRSGTVEADGEQLALLQRLTERYCVVWQTLSHSPRGTCEVARG